jgi:hypothetical protein
MKNTFKGIKPFAVFIEYSVKSFKDEMMEGGNEKYKLRASPSN